MQKTSEIVIGNRDGEHVSIRVASARDVEGWFGAEVEIHCDGWRGKINAEFYQDELVTFAEEIRVLHRNLTGIAQLVPIEPYITLKLEGDGKGHIVVDGVAQRTLGADTQLVFRIEIDQTYLPQIADAFSTANPPQ
jgi:hypothetical protein